jgi:nucleotide-binding universal stress UspA family protein
MSFQKILCAVDFSDGARVAMRRAAELAKESGATLTLVHAFQPPISSFSEPVVPPEVYSELEKEIDRSLVAWRSEALTAGAPKVETRRPVGAPWDAIVRAAKEGGHDLVVVGTHGRTGLAHVLLGSVAEKIVRHAPCAVLVVRV